MDQETSAIIQDLKNRLVKLETQRINQQQILPNAVKQRHIQDGDVLKLFGVNPPLPYFAQFGILSVALSSQVNVTTTLTFPIAFASTCSLVLTQTNQSLANSVSLYVSNTHAVSSTGCIIETRYIPNTNTTDTLTIAYLAIGY